MRYSLELRQSQKNSHVLLPVILFWMAILLHQSQVILGINISFADFFCLMVFINLVIRNQLIIPTLPLNFFIIVSLLVLATAVIYVPIQFNSNSNPAAIVSDYIKLSASFVYFLIGYNLSNINYLDKTIKWYSLFSILVGILGIIFTIFSINVFSNILFFGGTRFRGLMIDPNYYSVLQITGLVYFTRSKIVEARYKYLAVFITFLAVLTSGSKTGIITLICYLALRLIEYLFLKKKRTGEVVVHLFFIVFLILLAPLLFGISEKAMYHLTSSIPSFFRIQELLTDITGAVSESGSGRSDAWNVALQVIQLSPFLGVGIGTYTSLTGEMFQYGNLAHNTFLQLLAEWGIPLTTCFFGYVFFLLGKVSLIDFHRTETNLILRDFMIILLVGSMAISLNSARILWLILGALIYSANAQRVNHT
ncbi:O-antigen ligase family protein [Neobacillus niacini]|uniref:O-antigen ligase family protein n=1 Tax=Neobacillus niacini TaxID=86668 RepID=UPI0021CB5E03|nr:O-antigen ligase family protein [Neobacillus niacini]MCM3765947.1 O-antigen ligase family protein [Neobacillus niacini]